MTELSGGERARVELARVLASRADIVILDIAAALLCRAHLLMLDEPTNHLDLTARDALGAALADHPAAPLVATHDRALLERIGTRAVNVARWRSR